MDSKTLFEINKFKYPPTFFSDGNRLKANPSITLEKRKNNIAEILERLPKSSLVIFREYDLLAQNREYLSGELNKIAAKRNLSFLIGKDFQMAKKISAQGIHFSDRDLLSIKLRSYLGNRARNIKAGKRIEKKFLLTISCHDLKSLYKYQKFLPDRLFISPIFPTNSHINTRNLGILKLAYITNILNKKTRQKCNLSALGGINNNNLKTIRKLGLSAFGAIDLFLKLQKSS